MNLFITSQALVCIAIISDILSFQFKKREYILICLVISSLLVSIHFFLLGNTTAGLLMLVAFIRFILSIFTTSRKILYVLIIISIIITFLFFDGLISIVSLVATIFQTVAAFQHTDKKIREVMLVGSSLWIINNILSKSPMAVLMEIIFLLSNIIGYIRYYTKHQKSSNT